MIKSFNIVGIEFGNFMSLFWNYINVTYNNLFFFLVASPKRSIDAKCREASLEPLIKYNYCCIQLIGSRVTQSWSKQRLLSTYMKCPLIEFVPADIYWGLLSKPRQCLLVQKHRGNLQKQSWVQIVNCKKIDAGSTNQKRVQRTSLLRLKPHLL